MKVSVTTITPVDLDVDLLLMPLTEDDAAGRQAELAEGFGPSLQRSASDFSGKAEERVVLYPERARARRIALLGLGPRAGVDVEMLREVAAAGADLAVKCKAETVALVVPAHDLDMEAAGQAVAEGFVLGAYRFLRYKTQNEDTFAGPQRLVLHVAEQEKAARVGADRGRIVAEAVITARDLVNLSPDEKTATLLGGCCH
jgi:leucyl aminopeptidase